MKIVAFNVREDEKDFFKKYTAPFAADVTLLEESPSKVPPEKLAGTVCVSVITTPIGKSLLEAWKAVGIRHVSTRTVGYDHIDLEAAKMLGIAVSNVSYAPDSVADYAIMHMLMALRKMGLVMKRFEGQDFSLAGCRGNTLGSKTVGVIGTGKIGEAVIHCLHGFGSHILAYDLYPRDLSVFDVEYVPLETLLEQSDIITLHAPATKEGFHMLNREAFQKMKKGVILVNTARGTLVDTHALVEALMEEKVGACGLDVLEGEGSLYYQDYKGTILPSKELAILRSLPNVVLTPHTGFFTEQAVSDMIRISMEQCKKALEEESL